MNMDKQDIFILAAFAVVIFVGALNIDKLMVL